MQLNERQLALCESSDTDYSDIQALFLNCTLKRSPELSHTAGLIEISRAIMEKNGVTVTEMRPVDHDLAFGVWGDMREHGWETDDWPKIYALVKAADILVITTPIWLGEKSSVCTQVIERLYGNSGDLNEHGQYAYYGRGGRMPDHRQRGRRETLRDEHSLLSPAPGLCASAPGRRRLGRRGRTRAVLP